MLTSSTQLKRVLVINPNTSISITESFKPVIEELDLAHTEVVFWTSLHGPAIIKTQKQLYDSASQCLPPLLKLADKFDGFLAACYADHPLVHMLRSSVKQPVVSIFEASIFAAIRLLDDKSMFGIVTTGAAYEDLLDQGVKTMIGSSSVAKQFAGTCATGIGLEDLQPGCEEAAGKKVITATTNLVKKSGRTLRIVSMGGVILSGKEPWIRQACENELGLLEGRNVKIVDQLLAGMLTLDALLSGVQLQDVNFTRALR